MNDGTLSYSYDVLNRLIQVNRVHDGQVIGNYTYDTLNRRQSKAISNGGLTGDIPNLTTVFFYQNWQVMEERYQDFYLTPSRQYVWGQYIDECIQMKTLAYAGPNNLPPGDYYPLQDLLYRTTALTNSSGSIVEAYDYDAYGNTLIFKTAGTDGSWWADNATQANYGACDVLYCGYRYDPELQNYHVRNREYNPTLGRWLQRDPIGFKGGDWNLYAYVENKSVRYIDARGLCYEDPMYDGPASDPNQVCTASQEEANALAKSGQGGSDQEGIPAAYPSSGPGYTEPSSASAQAAKANSASDAAFIDHASDSGYDKASEAMQSLGEKPEGFPSSHIHGVHSGGAGSGNSGFGPGGGSGRGFGGGGGGSWPPGGGGGGSWPPGGGGGGSWPPGGGPGGGGGSGVPWSPNTRCVSGGGFGGGGVGSW